ncbi:MAG: potassium/proton antiporter [Planctomycetes bacterium]|nr:potassium/proton antiporter [Planctomycetota bacterium]
MHRRRNGETRRDFGNPDLHSEHDRRKKRRVAYRYSATAPALALAAHGRRSMLHSTVHNLPLVLIICGLMLAVAALGTKMAMRIGIPTALGFIGVGMLIGGQTDLRTLLQGYEGAYSIGNIALALILFYGGLSTDVRKVRGIWLPSITLATVGVLGVAGVTAYIIRILVPSAPWSVALMMGAVLGSTDAASVLQILARERLSGRVREIVELESGLNDPMAFILVATFTSVAMGGAFEVSTIPTIMWQMCAGALIGGGIGWLSSLAIGAFEEDSPEIYPVITIALALLAYGIAESLHSSGLLAVFMTALTLGNSADLPFRSTIVRFHASLAYLAQIVMFFVLGVLVIPESLLDVRVMASGTLIALILAFIARPLVVTPLLLLFRFPIRESLAVSWLGLRGAVPIILMMIPMTAARTSVGQHNLSRAFAVVFVCVVVGSIIPGSTVRWVMRLLRVRLPPIPRPSTTIDMITKTPLDTRMMIMVVQPGSAIDGKYLAEARLPGEITIALVIRGARTHRVRGDTRLEAGDEVALSLPDRMVPIAQVLFGEVRE